MRFYFAISVLVSTIIIDRPFNANACSDLTFQCSKFQTLCDTTPSLQKICPVTCNRCPRNPCNSTNGGCNQLCSWKEGIVTCGCLPGFKLQDDKKTCVDINECKEGPNPCKTVAAQICVNTVGSYSCQANNCERQEPGTINYYKRNTCCRPSNKTCGVNLNIRQAFNRANSSSPQKRIANGENAASTQWPWMVQLTFRGRHLCGGTLISKDWIVTSSLCVSTAKAEDLKVTLGHVRNVVISFVDLDNKVERDVAQIIRHQSNLVSGFEQNNIALLKLSSPVTFNDNISPICLSCGQIPKPGTKCWATGFGSLVDSRHSDLPEILQEVDVPIVDTNRCIRAYGRTNSDISINRATMLCAGYEDGGKDACDGDGGGPLMCQREDSCEWYLAGITGFGVGCGRQGYYGIYTNVFRFEKWIREMTGEDAKSLCTKDYNPCSSLRDEIRGCRVNAGACGEGIRNNCKLTCCLRQIGLEPDCFDSPRFSGACELFRNQCDAPDLRSFLQKHCRRTCAFC